MAKPALGRGLGALLGGTPIAKPPVHGQQTVPATAPAPDVREHVRRVPVAQLRPCPFQPRKDFGPDALKELADSIKEQGVVQPLVARERNGHLELIAGERRWRAAQLAGLAEVPVIVRQADDRAVLELALIENLQRENLNAIEEAQGYSQLMEQFQLTQEQVAVKVSKSRAAVANALRLLKLPTVLQAYVREGRLSVGHAKAILGLIGSKEQTTAAERILKDGLSVRQTEELIAKLQAAASGSTATAGSTAVAPARKDTHVADIENRIRERLGTKVQLRYAEGKGLVQISFFSDDEFERILAILGVSE